MRNFALTQQNDLDGYANKKSVLEQSCLIGSWPSTAHRDLVELLTFVLPPSADRSQVDAYLKGTARRLQAWEFRQGSIAMTGLRASGANSKWRQSTGLQCNYCLARSFTFLSLRASFANIERLLDMYE
jgi:hypothetical protein